MKVWFSKIVLLLAVLVSTIMTGCKRYDDTILEITVISQPDSVAIENIAIEVIKRKPAFILGYKEVEGYSGQTDLNGEAAIMIDNYNREKYDYLIKVNDYEGTPPDYGGYTYSVWSTVLEENELNERLIVRLTQIPFPDL